MAINLLLVDDQRLFRHSLRLLLEREPDLKVVGEASNGQEAYEVARALRPDVVLMDVEMPKLDGIGATRILAKELVGIKVLMLSSFSDDERVLHGIQAGAVGYIVKDASPEEFVKIIRATFDGVEVASPYLANLHPVVVKRLRGPMDERPWLTASGSQDLNLSHREMEIVELLVQGKSNKEMADELCVSTDTIKSHLQHIFRKIGVTNRLEAVVFFLTGRRVSQP
ncbi:MAG: response regulator [Nitrospirales bacterium]